MQVQNINQKINFSGIQKSPKVTRLFKNAVKLIEQGKTDEVVILGRPAIKNVPAEEHLFIFKDKNKNSSVRCT